MSESAEVIALLHVIFPDKPLAWAVWLTRANPLLDNKPPYEVMSNGRGVLVLCLLHAMAAGVIVRDAEPLPAQYPPVNL